MDTFEAIIRYAVELLILCNLSCLKKHKYFYGFLIFSPVIKLLQWKGPLHGELDPLL